MSANVLPILITITLPELVWLFTVSTLNTGIHSCCDVSNALIVSPKDMAKMVNVSAALPHTFSIRLVLNVHALHLNHIRSTEPVRLQDATIPNTGTKNSHNV